MQKVSSTALVLVLSMAGLAQAQQTREPVNQQKAMEMMMRAATPGDEHKALNGMVGTFDVKLKFWPANGAPPMESTGKSVNEWVLGGRWVQQRFDGSFMGQPFSGIGYTGYDNVTHTYVGTWMDTMTTSVMSSHGNPDPSGKVYTFTSVVKDPVSGEGTQVDSKIIVTDADHHTMEMWGAGPDGKVYKMMEIAYTRKK